MKFHFISLEFICIYGQLPQKLNCICRKSICIGRKFSYSLKWVGNPFSKIWKRIHAQEIEFQICEIKMHSGEFRFHCEKSTRKWFIIETDYKSLMLVCCGGFCVLEYVLVKKKSVPYLVFVVYAILYCGTLNSTDFWVLLSTLISMKFSTKIFHANTQGNFSRFFKFFSRFYI